MARNKSERQLKLRPLSAERLRKKFEEVKKIDEALKKADTIRPGLMHERVRAVS